MTKKRETVGGGAKAIHAAVMIIAVAVVLLWQPYWHTETREIGVAVLPDFATEAKARETWITSACYNDYEIRITHNPSYTYYPASGYTFLIPNNETAAKYHLKPITVPESWSVEIYHVWDETVYNNCYFVPKIMLAALFLITVLSCILADIGKAKLKEYLSLD